MKFVPNSTKICKYCHEVITYGEQYLATETLDRHNDIVLDVYHVKCQFGALSGYAQAASGIGGMGSYPSSGAFGNGTGGYGGSSIWWNAQQQAQTAQIYNDNYTPSIAYYGADSNTVPYADISTNISEEKWAAKVSATLDKLIEKYGRKNEANQVTTDEGKSEQDRAGVRS